MHGSFSFMIGLLFVPLVDPFVEFHVVPFAAVELIARLEFVFWLPLMVALVPFAPKLAKQRGIRTTVC